MKVKQVYNQRLKARIDERATRGSRGSLLSRETHHWPLESLEFAYAVACVEIVLLHSDKANTIYNEIREAWELPGCRDLIGGFKDCLPVTNDWQAKALKAREKGEPIPDCPDEWLDTYFKHAPAYFEGEAHNIDWEYLLNKIKELILVGFNRQIDQDNETWKVIPYTSPYLAGVIILRSQAEYCKVKLENLNKYRPTRIDSQLYDLNTIMADKPTAGTERQIYRKLVKVYQDYGFTLKHDAKLLKDADQWYKCRVNPGSIEAYLDELANLDLPIYLERSNIETAIAPYDEATGYPRKWRE